MAEAKTKEFVAVGRRKTSIARVRMTNGTGKFIINGQDLHQYFPTPILRKVIMQPLELTQKENSYDFKVTISGGGKSGQAGALRHGIARALVDCEPGLRGPVKKENFLTRDPRMKERKKYGQRGARRRYQFSKR